MKNQFIYFLILLIIPLNLLCQNKSVYFELKEDKFDSIVFKSKKIDKYQNFIKMPKKRCVKFLIYKDGVASKMKLKTVYLGRFNTIESIKKSSDGLSQIKVLKGSTTNLFTGKSNKTNNLEIAIKVNTHFTKDNEMYTGSDSYDLALKNNPQFFLQ